MAYALPVAVCQEWQLFPFGVAGVAAKQAYAVDTTEIGHTGLSDIEFLGAGGIFARWKLR
jgi:hypothetical protein